MNRLPARRFPDRVVWRRVTTALNEYGEHVEIETDVEVAANLQPQLASDELLTSGVQVSDRRVIFMRGSPDPLADKVLIDGEEFSVRDAVVWPAYTRVEVERVC